MVHPVAGVEMMAGVVGAAGWLGVPGCIRPRLTADLQLLVTLMDGVRHLAVADIPLVKILLSVAYGPSHAILKLVVRRSTAAGAVGGLARPPAAAARKPAPAPIRLEN